MADENIEVTTSEVTSTETSQVDSVEPSQPSTETIKQDATTEHMIPKSRFDEINNKLKTLEEAQAKAAKEREANERKQLEEQNNFKALYEKAQQEAAQAADQLRVTQLNTLKKDIAQELGIPSRLATRLSGETEDEIRKDAALVLADLPKPSAPNVGNQTGSGNAPVPGALTEAQKAELAAVYGVNPQYIQ